MIEKNKDTTKRRRRAVRRSVLGVLLLFVVAVRWLPSWGEWYAVNCYPAVSAGLSHFSALFAFSVGDCFIAGGCLWIVGYLIYALIKRKGLKRRLLRVAEFAVWVFVWFYLAWGLNYFRLPFYARTGVPEVAYSAGEFRDFLSDYAGGLNGSFAQAADSARSDTAFFQYLPYGVSGGTDTEQVKREVVGAYGAIAPLFRLVSPSAGLRAKPMLFSGGMSRVGVSGYMGPFFSEFNLNRELLSVEYPFTYAHELAHRLGVASEAEANLYAYLVCTRSDAAEIRFSGFFSLLGYVAANARCLLPEDEFAAFYKSIDPEIVARYNGRMNYWRSKYNAGAGKVQSRVYNSFLKGNNIPSGTKNYSEVVGLLISWREFQDQAASLYQSHLLQQDGGVHIPADAGMQLVVVTDAGIGVRNFETHIEKMFRINGRQLP